jgi:hypothetical protein
MPVRFLVDQELRPASENCVPNSTSHHPAPRNAWLPATIGACRRRNSPLAVSADGIGKWNGPLRARKHSFDATRGFGQLRSYARALNFLALVVAQRDEGRPILLQCLAQDLGIYPRKKWRMRGRCNERRRDQARSLLDASPRPTSDSLQFQCLARVAWPRVPKVVTAEMTTAAATHNAATTNPNRISMGVHI